MAWGIVIKSMFDALTAFLQLRAKTYYYDLIQKNREKQLAYAQEIEKLRSSSKPDDADRADLMRKYLISEKQFAEHLSAVYIATNTGKQDSNT